MVFVSRDLVVSGIQVERGLADVGIANEPQAARAQYLVHGVAVGRGSEREERREVRGEEALRIDGSAFEELEHYEGIVQLGLPGLSATPIRAVGIRISP
jgi:hypothetical protein